MAACREHIEPAQRAGRCDPEYVLPRARRRAPTDCGSITHGNPSYNDLRRTSQAAVGMEWGGGNQAFGPADIPRLAEARSDWMVILFTAAVTVITALFASV
jgi:hypothetical protein